MNKVYEMIQEMRVSRGWDKTDTDIRLVQFLILETSELLECYMQDSVDEEAVKGELADVLMYALSICVDHGWDYQQLIQEKIEDVKKRYPAV